MKYNTADLFNMIQNNNEAITTRLDNIEARLTKLENAKTTAPKKSAVEKNAVFVKRDGTEVACTEAQKKNWEKRRNYSEKKWESTARFHFAVKWKNYLSQKCKENNQRLDQATFKKWVADHVEADMQKWVEAGRPCFWQKTA